MLLSGSDLINQCMRFPCYLFYNLHNAADAGLLTNMLMIPCRGKQFYLYNAARIQIMFSQSKLRVLKVTSEFSICRSGDYGQLMLTLFYDQTMKPLFLTN